MPVHSEFLVECVTVIMNDTEWKYSCISSNEEGKAAKASSRPENFYLIIQGGGNESTARWDTAHSQGSLRVLDEAIHEAVGLHFRRKGDLVLPSADEFVAILLILPGSVPCNREDVSRLPGNVLSYTYKNKTYDKSKKRNTSIPRLKRASPG
jgi:hypothetical protein